MYFIQAEAGGLIKIGWAADVGKRLRHMQAVCPIPLRVLAATPGTVPDEKVLHERFAAHRKHGEWFAPAPDLVAHVATIDQPSREEAGAERYGPPWHPDDDARMRRLRIAAEALS